MLAVVESPWVFHPDPNVVALVVALVVGYVVAIRRLGPRFAPRPDTPVSRLQMASFGIGVASFWMMSDWPVHQLADNWLYSAHTVQHLTYALITAPLLLMGTPGWLVRALVGHGWRHRAMRVLMKPLLAFALFNIVMVLMHWPAVVDIMVRNNTVHATFHIAALATALVMWMPLVSPLPELPRLRPPGSLLYLFMQSILPTVPASFLTFGTTVLYKHYANVPRIWGISAISDQQVAGILMKVGAGFLLWAMIAVLFFSWQAEEETQTRPGALDFDELELELTTMGTTR